MTKNEMNRLIAEKCEGRTDFFYGLASGEVCYESQYQGGPLRDIDDYFTDISACVRAAEAWVAKDPKTRKWWLRRDWNISAVVDQGTMSDVAIMDTPASALATALVRAVK